jgi:hypothetical protein
MSEITTIGLDLAKHVFQVHGIDAQGTTVLRKRLRRGQVLAFFSRIPRCVVGLEACATAHYWARARAAAVPVGMSWMWTLAYGYHEDRTPTHGYAATREPAMPAFARSWRRA